MKIKDLKQLLSSMDEELEVYIEKNLTLHNISLSPKIYHAITYFNQNREIGGSVYIEPTSFNISDHTSTSDKKHDFKDIVLIEPTVLTSKTQILGISAVVPIKKSLGFSHSSCANHFHFCSNINYFREDYQLQSKYESLNVFEDYQGNPQLSINQALLHLLVEYFQTGVARPYSIGNTYEILQTSTDVVTIFAPFIPPTIP